ncbi:pollen-specific leucine-rich repeat extensin-like protein 3 [Iris pallida]|uniref:Pollen-specific leucine-rich repeat extensin-like protein 3 n=1 Tax=Iris pallida TaxID=29817 RepID=A0AAX6HIJ5_IRIPA|nr:pollen-specific leucine-rich repeat extensin-like protein 3 [Iris pallida]
MSLRPSHRCSTPEKRPCLLQQDSVSSAAALTVVSTGRIGGATPCPQPPRNPSTFARSGRATPPGAMLRPGFAPPHSPPKSWPLPRPPDRRRSLRPPEPYSSRR